MAGLRGIPDCQVAFHEQGLRFAPDIRVEMDTSDIDTSKTNIGVAMEGQKLVREIVQKATDLFQTLQSCEVLNVEETGSKERQQRLTKTCEETLQNLKELFVQLRNIYEESRKRMPEVYHDQVSNTGNIESLLPLVDNGDQMAVDDIMAVENVEKETLVKEIQQQNLKIKVLIEKFRTLIQDLNLIVQLETSQ